MPTLRGLFRHARAGTLTQTVAARGVRLVQQKLRRVHLWTKEDRFHQLSASRRMVKAFEERLDHHPEHLMPMGNYALDARVPLSRGGSVVSAGLGNDAAFDVAMHAHHRGPIHIYDPTPGAVRTFGETLSRDYANIKFHPVGVAERKAVLRFTAPWHGGSASATLPHFGFQHFDAPVDTLRSLVQQHTLSPIDVLKMDIEGAGLGVMRSMLTDSIFPRQIVVELERPSPSPRRVQAWLDEVQRVLDGFVAQGYVLNRLPREQYSYFGIEVLLVRADALTSRNGHAA